MSYNPEQTVAKRVYLHRNGQPQQPPKMFVVNQRQVRDFNSFLSQATGGLKASVAVRSIYTPFTGTRVHSLEQLEPGRHYVAGGTEKFKKGKYEGQTEVLLPKRKPYLQQFHIPLRTQQAVVASARYRKPTEKPITIHVFRNGDENFGGVKVLLGKRSLLTMDKVFEIVTEKADLFTPAKRIFTVDGRMVQNLEEITDKEEYVAVEGSKVFKKVAYTRNETFNKSPTRRVTVPRIKRLKPFAMTEGRTVADARATQDEQDGQPSSMKQFSRHLRPKPPAGQRVMKPGVKKFSRKERPMGGRKDKEARELALRDQREDSVFGGSPVMGHAIQPMPSPPGSGLKPAEPVDIAETDQTEEMVTGLGEVPEDEVEEEGRVLQEEQDPVIELHPRAEEEDKIPEEGDEVPMEKPSQEESLATEQASQIMNASGGSTVQGVEDEIEEQVEEEQPAAYPSGLAEFQTQTAKQTVDLSVHRKQSDGGSGQQREETAVAESKSPSPPHEEDRQSQRGSNLSNASKSSMRSMSEGDLKELSKSSLRTDLKDPSKTSVKSGLKDASKSSVKSGLKDASKVSVKSNVSSGSHVSKSSRKTKGAALTSSNSSVKGEAVQGTTSGVGSARAAEGGGESGTPPVPEPSATQDPSEGSTHGDGDGEKMELSKKAEDGEVDREEGSTEEQLPKQEEEEGAFADSLYEGEAPETDNQEPLTDTSMQGTGMGDGGTQPVEHQPQEA